MQRNSKRIIGGLLVASTIILAGVISFAQQQMTQEQAGQERHERRGGPGWGERGGFPGGHIFERLNLTDAQKAQMEQISTRYRETFKSLRQRNGGGERRGGGFDIFNGGTFDEAAVRAAAQARANAEVEMEVARAHMMYDLYNVLTPEQKAQLATERQQWEQKRQEFRNRRKAGEGQNQ